MQELRNCSGDLLPNERLEWERDVHQTQSEHCVPIHRKLQATLSSPLALTLRLSGCLDVS